MFYMLLAIYCCDSALHAPAIAPHAPLRQRPVRGYDSDFMLLEYLI